MRKKKYFKAVYSAHIDFKDKRYLNRELGPLKPGESFCLKNEQKVSYSDILETTDTAINVELKKELSKYINLEVSDVQVQAVYEGSIEVIFTVVLDFLNLVGGLKDLYDAVKLIREIAGKHIAKKLKNEYGDYFIVKVDAVSPDFYDIRYDREFIVGKSEMDESSKRDAFFYYLLIANIVLILIIGVLVFGAVRKVYF